MTKEIERIEGKKKLVYIKAFAEMHAKEMSSQ